jgi:hypothetical protein
MDTLPIFRTESELAALRGTQAAIKAEQRALFTQSAHAALFGKSGAGVALEQFQWAYSMILR